MVKRQPGARGGPIAEPIPRPKYAHSNSANPNADPNARTTYTDANPYPDSDTNQNAFLPDQYTYLYGYENTYATADKATQP
jgi:hypothetical protein